MRQPACSLPQSTVDLTRAEKTSLFAAAEEEDEEESPRLLFTLVRCFPVPDAAGAGGRPGCSSRASRKAASWLARCWS